MFHDRHSPWHRTFLDFKSSEQVVHAFVTSRIDYCNSLLVSTSQQNIDKIQRVQNSAARIIMKQNKYCHITPLLFKLHWLPISERITFKLLVIVYKCLNNLAPSYLSCLIERYIPARSLRSADKLYLNQPSSWLATAGDKAFAVAAPRLWNVLPMKVKSSQSLGVFKSNLKSFLFKKHFKI